MPEEDPERIAITEEVRAVLRGHKQRTGCGARAACHNDPSAPDGLKAKLVDAWLTGSVRTARGDYLSYVLEK